MSVPEYFPYKSSALRDSYFAHYDALAARQWPIASETRMVPTTRGATFVRIGGPAGAPPLVLLHGAGATSLMWAPNIQALSEEYRTIAVDQMGEMGRSTCTQPVRNLEDLQDWLNELFDALKLGNGINLAGMSYGGALTAQYALHFPRRLNKAVLIAPGNTVLRASNEFMVRLILAVIPTQRFMPKFARWIFADLARNDPQWLNEILEELFTNMRILVRRKTPIPPVLTDAEWGSLRVPALFLVGEHETIYSPEKAVRRLKRVAPDIRIEVIPGAGHDLTMVQAALVNRLILEFLRAPVGAGKVSGAGAR
jgi:pimeloyl-ACP methyl ester carboxylesterase